MNGDCLSPFTLIAFLTGEQVPLECAIALGSEEVAPQLTVLGYLPLFLWTCALELPLYGAFKFFRPQLSFQHILLGLMIANLATHPIVTFVIPLMGQHGGWSALTAVLVKESFAPLVETAVLRQWFQSSWRLAFAVSLCANLFSWWVGALLPEAVLRFGL